MQTYCTNYHPFTPENTFYFHDRGYLRRGCRACHRTVQRNYKRRNRRRLKKSVVSG